MNDADEEQPWPRRQNEAIAADDLLRVGVRIVQCRMKCAYQRKFHRRITGTDTIMIGVIFAS